MIVKGRQYTGTHEGERNPKVKLTAKEVLEIRTLKDKGKRQFELAKMFGVSSSQISLIVKREAWTHI
jgi:transcriptional regulator